MHRIEATHHAIPPLLAATVLLACQVGEQGVEASRAGAAAGTNCGQASLTQQCTCADGRVGAQVCDGAAWAACVCTDPPASPAMGGSGGVGAGGGMGAPVTGVASLQIPSGISFDWSPRTPFPDGTCEPGLYVGSFDGVYSSPGLFGIPVPVSGDVTLTLAESVDGETFEISDGEVNGTANGAVPFRADVVGTLDCGAGQFTGRLEMGNYNFAWTDYAFSGPLLARYNRRTRTFEQGTWDVLEGAGPNGGNGTWQATHQP